MERGEGEGVYIQGEDEKEGLRKCERSGGEGRRRGSLHTGRRRKGGIKKVREKWWRGEKAREETDREDERDGLRE